MATFKPLKRLAENGPLVGGAIASLIKSVGATLRFEIDDQCGMCLHQGHDRPVIWVAWHNRVFILPSIHQQELYYRPGTVITSASRDGEIISQVMTSFGVESVRGSSSKKGRQALVGAIRTIRSGRDLVVTPDGPRGPRYELRPGLVKIAQLTGAPLFMVGIRPRRSFRLKTWDRLHIPYPFSTVDVQLAPLRTVDRDADVETERAAIEQQMIELNGGTD